MGSWSLCTIRLLGAFQFENDLHVVSSAKCFENAFNCDGCLRHWVFLECPNLAECFYYSDVWFHIPFLGTGDAYCFV